MTEYYDDDLDFEDEEMTDEEFDEFFANFVQAYEELQEEEGNEDFEHVRGEVARIERNLGRRLTHPEQREVITTYLESPDDQLNPQWFAFDATNDGARQRYSAQVAEDAISDNDSDPSDHWQGGFGPPLAEED